MREQAGGHGAPGMLRRDPSAWPSARFRWVRRNPMSNLAEISSAGVTGSGSNASPRGWPPLAAALTVGAVYYVGARVGMVLTAAPLPLSVLWPPNALLFAALLLAPRRWWWVFIAAAFPAHLLAELQGNVPVSMVLCWFVSNVTEALIGASFVRWLAGASPGLNRVRTVIVLCGARGAGGVAVVVPRRCVRAPGRLRQGRLLEPGAGARAGQHARHADLRAGGHGLVDPRAALAADHQPSALGGVRCVVRRPACRQHRGFRHRHHLRGLAGSAVPADAVLDLGRAALRATARERVIHGGGLPRDLGRRSRPRPVHARDHPARRAADPTVPDHHRCAAAVVGRGDRGAATRRAQAARIGGVCFPPPSSRARMPSRSAAAATGASSRPTTIGSS